MVRLPARAGATFLVTALAALNSFDVTPARAHVFLASQAGMQTVEVSEFDEAFAIARRSVVRVVAIHPAARGTSASLRRSQGKPVASLATGVVVDADGHVVTTARSVAGCQELRILTPTGREVDGKIVGLDAATDLALVQIESGLVEPIAFARDDGVQVGRSIATIGHSYSAAHTQDVGKITWRYHEPYRSYIQMTTTVFPGNSGGAAIDSHGRLVGIVIGALATVEGTDEQERAAAARGRAFAIPVDELDDLIADMRQYGMVRRGYLGVRIEQGRIIDPARPDQPFEVGVAVSEVMPGGPAWNAGLRPGDLVVAVDGEPVNSPEELVRMVSHRRAGTQAQFVWVRGDIRHEASVSLASTPDSLVLAALQNLEPLPTMSRTQLQTEAAELQRKMEARWRGQSPDPR